VTETTDDNGATLSQQVTELPLMNCTDRYVAILDPKVAKRIGNSTLMCPVSLDYVLSGNGFTNLNSFIDISVERLSGQP